MSEAAAASKSSKAGKFFFFLLVQVLLLGGAFVAGSVLYNPLIAGLLEMSAMSMPGVAVTNPVLMAPLAVGLGLSLWRRKFGPLFLGLVVSSAATFAAAVQYVGSNMH